MTHDHAADTYLVITFPENDFVLTTTPSLTCDVDVGLVANTGGIQCVFDSNTVTVSNYVTYTAGT